jgi:Concanavalin A-like lectin/glucanases superfamily/SPRY domain
MSVINSIPLIAAGDDGYQISRSVRLRSSATAYFNRTPASAGNRQTFTWSGWVKRGTIPSSGNIGLFTVGASDATSDGILFTGAGVFFVFFANATYSLTTSAVFRDPSAWYHIVLSVDTTQATAANRVKLYVNGVEVTAFSASSYPTLNFNCYFNGAAIHAIGRQQQTSPANYFDGYLTDINFIDGQALTPSSFGEADAVTGVWKPKKYAGTYGTNGFYLNFSDPSAATAAAIGKDYSGNGNNWTPNNISVTAGVTYDSMLDAPTMWADGGNGRGNYGLLNPMDKTLTDGSITNGNLTLTGTNNWNACRGSFGMSSGKWYWETAHSVYNQSICGIADSAWPTSTNYPGFSSTGYSAAYGQNALKYVDGANSSYGATFTIGDVIGYALDMDAGTLTCYKNGVSQGTMVTGLTAYGTIFPAIAAANGAVINANFGQRPFAYTPPTGFKALNTQNLPDSTIKKGNQYFDVNTWSGTGATQSITNGGFQPDLVWVKSRSNVAYHNIVDAVRGLGNTLYSNATDAETFIANQVTTLNSNGFTLGADANGGTNYSGRTYVGWQWKESVSAGFDIVTYTGTGANRTVAHSLGVAPAMLIVKKRSAVGQWIVQMSSFASGNNYLYLNGTAALGSESTLWNSTKATSASFSVGTNSDTNANGATYVAYLFSEVAGFSKLGSYTGNGSADGPFVYLGFRPRFVMIKNTAIGSNWAIWDTSRSAYNQVQDYLLPNLSAAEGNASTVSIDVTANGFKVRGTDTGINGSGNTIIYAAFAENPMKYSLAR